MDKLRAELPSGYLIEVGNSGRVGTRTKFGQCRYATLFGSGHDITHDSAEEFVSGNNCILTAPLGLIGVVLFLLLFNKPFGFVAMLGTIALSGMIMRNSLILIDQIEQDRKAGHPTWEAIIDATVRRFRPIILTALAAVLAMIPLSRSIFFGPMAVAIMGGLIVATLLTLFFLPALQRGLR